MPTRLIEIYDLQLLAEYADSARFKVRCSKGTYVRTLGKDLALKLGTVGHLTELRRTKCGIFSLADTILLDSLEKIEYVDKRRQSLLPIETSLRDIAEIAVSAEDARKLSMGQGLSPKNYPDIEPADMAAVKFHNCLIALVRIDERKISPLRVFHNIITKEISDVDNK
jgi:tRNA pseudouridine55 synthase